MKYSRIMQHESAFSKQRFTAMTIALAISILVMSAVSAPLINFYLALYAIFCTTFVFKRTEFKSRWFWPTFLFVNFACSHMCILGAIALIIGYNPYVVLNDFRLCSASLIITLIWMTISMMMLSTGSFIAKVRQLEINPLSLRLLIHFCWYALAYVMLDSLFTMYDLPYLLPSLFLVGSCLLLFLQMALFLMYIISIAKNSVFEEEYFRLEQQHEDQLRIEMELKQAAYSDSLTGAYTRRYATELMQLLLDSHEAFSLVYIDMNRLKAINDEFGHKAGDACLIRLTKILNEGLHDSDVLVRFGGDEFIIIMPYRSAEEAGDMIEDIKRSAGQLKYDDVGGIKISFSYGIKYVPENSEENMESLLSEADRKMYKQKFTSGGSRE